MNKYIYIMLSILLSVITSSCNRTTKAKRVSDINHNHIELKFNNIKFVALATRDKKGNLVELKKLKMEQWNKIYKNFITNAKLVKKPLKSNPWLTFIIHYNDGKKESLRFFKYDKKIQIQNHENKIWKVLDYQYANKYISKIIIDKK